MFENNLILSKTNVCLKLDRFALKNLLNALLQSLCLRIQIMQYFMFSIYIPISKFLTFTK